MKLTFLLTQKVMKTFKVFGMFHKINRFREQMKYRKQSQKCHQIATQIAELDHSDKEIQRQLCYIRDQLYSVAHQYKDMEPDVFEEEN